MSSHPCFSTLPLSHSSPLPLFTTTTATRPHSRSHTRVLLSSSLSPALAAVLPCSLSCRSEQQPIPSVHSCYRSTDCFPRALHLADSCAPHTVSHLSRSSDGRPNKSVFTEDDHSVSQPLASWVHCTCTSLQTGVSHPYQCLLDGTAQLSLPNYFRVNMIDTFNGINLHYHFSSSSPLFS